MKHLNLNLVMVVVMNTKVESFVIFKMFTYKSVCLLAVDIMIY